MMLANVLPGPKHVYAEEKVEVEKKVAAVVKSSSVPLYLKRTGYVPVNVEDFGEGGAFPEIHIVQYPLNMGKPGFSSTAVISVNVDEKGQVQYDSLVKQGSNGNRIVQTSLNDMKEKEHSEAKVALPEEKEEQDTADRTRLALEGLLMTKINSSKASTVVHSSEIVEPTYIRYTPNPDAPGFNPAAKQRVIRMVEAQVDPMEPPKHKNKKVPRGPPSPPVPVLHSPPRKLTVADQQAWQIPPCISNWKNARGYTIPLDKRLAADGRGLQEVTINNKFAMLSEALYISERKASEDLRIRSQIRKKMALQEKEDKEGELRDMALKARMERAGLGGSVIDINSRDAGPNEDDFDGDPYAGSSRHQGLGSGKAAGGNEDDNRDERGEPSRISRHGAGHDERRDFDSRVDDRDRYDDDRGRVDDRRCRYDDDREHAGEGRRDRDRSDSYNRRDDDEDRRRSDGRREGRSYDDYDHRDQRRSSRDDYERRGDRDSAPDVANRERESEREREHARHGENEEERVARQQRERLRIERRKDREREIRLDNMKGNMRKNKIDRDAGRDISEKIALGMLKGTGQLTGEALYDSRLFNQSAGMDSGFGADDEYSTYTKPLFDKGEATSMYRPKKDDTGIYGDVDAQLEKLKDTSRFKPDKGFKGTQGASGGGRDAPVQFEKAQLSSRRAREDDTDPFGIGDIVKSKRSRYDDEDE